MATAEPVNSRREQTTFLVPSSPAKSAAEARSPARVALTIVFVEYLALTLVTIGIGLLLTHALAGSIGRWDQHVSEWFEAHRSLGWDRVTGVASNAANTEPEVLLAAVVIAVLAFVRRFAEALFLATALVLEVSVFLTVTVFVDRARPDVAHLDAAPPTSSFPSGHTAAATVMLVGLALIVTCCTSNTLARVAAALGAAFLAIAVGFGRVYRGMHHPTDVIVGLLLGLACLAGAAIAIRAAESRRKVSAARAASEHAAHRHGQPLGQALR